MYVVAKLHLPPSDGTNYRNYFSLLPNLAKLQYILFCSLKVTSFMNTRISHECPRSDHVTFLEYQACKIVDMSFVFSTQIQIELLGLKQLGSTESWLICQLIRVRS